VRLGLEDQRIHSLILGYWHTIVTPPMVFATLLAEIVEEMRAKGIHKPVVVSLAGDVEVEEASEYLSRTRSRRIRIRRRSRWTCSAPSTSGRAVPDCSDRSL
jgi:hypothetical protein